MATPGAEPPAWAYLLAHHPPARYARTLRVPFGATPVHLCTRCTGELLGALALLGVALGAGGRGFFAVLPAQLLAATLPAVAAVDWLTQSTGSRESSNGIRLLSGALLGFAFADLLGVVVTQPVVLALGGVALLVAYLAAVLLVLRQTGAWRRVLEEHFPGL